ncbi:GntR family transcriptional regulator [Actinocatenispora rupis]|uniref:GntR family transcriptional regulator n=1 Tax=Actinocatenispora rupis TaxID=519421 RepID=UPI00194158C4|nr:GntR family transcriptional regulator [Actinocatenispora rupis]
MPDRPTPRSSLADDVYESVKAQVMDLAIAPGERVNIDALARELTVSPTPVREALARLESDGLVRKRPMSGYSTTPLLTAAEFAHLFEMRLLLEVPAARLAAARAPAAAFPGLRAAAVPPDEAGDEPPAWTDPGGARPSYRRYAAFTAHDARFHELVADLSGNPMLAEAIRRLHAHLHLHRLYLPGRPVADTGAEHHRVAEAVAAGDPDAAAAAMTDHLTAARTRHIVVFTGGSGQDVVTGRNSTEE